MVIIELGTAKAGPGHKAWGQLDVAQNGKSTTLPVVAINGARPSRCARAKSSWTRSMGKVVQRCTAGIAGALYFVKPKAACRRGDRLFTVAFSRRLNPACYLQRHRAALVGRE